MNWKDRPPTLSKYLVGVEKVVQYWEEDKIVDYQIEAIKIQIQHAYENCAFYRKKFEDAGIKPSDIKRLEDLEKVPLSSKAEMRGKPWVLLSVKREDVAQVHASTGTTKGEPNYVLFTWNDLYTLDMGPAYTGLLPVEEDDILINALPYEMSSAGLSFHRVFQDALKSIVVPTGKGGHYSTPDKTLEMMKELQATVMITTPSYAIYLSEVAESLGITLGEDIKLRLMWLTGEGCSPAFRKRVENIWKCRGYMYYGSLEAGPMGMECVAQEGLHIPVGHVYIEIVDEKTGERLGPGEVGNIVVTTLLREGAPFIRYNTEDLGYIDDEPCSCIDGDEEPCVRGPITNKIHLRGRREDHIKIGLDDYSPFYIEEFLMRIPEVGNWYQFIVDESTVEEDGILIRAEHTEGVEVSDEISEMIGSKVEYGCGVPSRVELVPPGGLPRSGGKTERVIKKEVIG